MPKTAGAPVGVPQSDEPAKKKDLDPKVIAVGAFLLLGGVAAVMMSGMLGGGGGETPVAPQEDPTVTGGGGGTVVQGGVAPPPVSGPVASGGAPPAPVPIPFKTVSSPGGGFKTGTVGILLAGNATSPAGAAKFAKNQFARNGGWENMQVAVFTDQATADAFAAYQRSRNSEPLTSVDFKALADRGVWAKTPAFLDSKGKQERIYVPSSNPNSWWLAR